MFQAMVGPLSPDFLRVTTARDIQESADRQAALALYQQQSAASYMVHIQGPADYFKNILYSRKSKKLGHYSVTCHPFLYGNVPVF